jgi:hypothetical protein
MSHPMRACATVWGRGAALHPCNDFLYQTNTLLLGQSMRPQEHLVCLVLLSVHHLKLGLYLLHPLCRLQTLDVVSVFLTSHVVHSPRVSTDRTRLSIHFRKTATNAALSAKCFRL